MSLEDIKDPAIRGLLKSLLLSEQNLKSSKDRFDLYKSMITTAKMFGNQERVNQLVNPGMRMIYD